MLLTKASRTFGSRESQTQFSLKEQKKEKKSTEHLGCQDALKDAVSNNIDATTFQF